MFFILTKSAEERSQLISFLKNKGIHAVFHYLPLHSSDFFHDKHDGRELPNTDRFSDCLLRLPFFNEMTEAEVNYVASSIHKFYFK
jgi:dTDP-4-amino-4,6-dideoxygalactose transaminase